MSAWVRTAVIVISTALVSSAATWWIVSRLDDRTITSLPVTEIETRPMSVTLYLPGHGASGCDPGPVREEVEATPGHLGAIEAAALRYLERLQLDPSPHLQNLFLDSRGIVYLQFDDSVWLEQQSGTCGQWGVLEGLATTLAANSDAVSSLRLIFARPISENFPLDVSRAIPPRWEVIDLPRPAKG